jgi:predicted  nucleic acid-binding Zn-ribbon protein
MIMPKDKTDQVAEAPSSTITLEQAHELRNEITRLNAELYSARVDLRRTQAEHDQKQRHYELELKTFKDNRVHYERLQEELLAAREGNIVLRNKLLAIHRAIDGGV